MQKLLLWRQVLSALCPPGIPRSRSAKRERERERKIAGRDREREGELEDTRVRQEKEEKEKKGEGDGKQGTKEDDVTRREILFTINHLVTLLFQDY